MTTQEKLQVLNIAVATIAHVSHAIFSTDEAIKAVAKCYQEMIDLIK